MRIFLICPVRYNDTDEQDNIFKYGSSLEERGDIVHWPRRDTEQDDPTGGLNICRMNFKAILNSDEIHIWYNEASNGSKFDMGGVFMLVEVLGYNKRIVLANRDSAIDIQGKSFFKVFNQIAG